MDIVILVVFFPAVNMRRWIHGRDDRALLRVSDDGSMAYDKLPQKLSIDRTEAIFPTQASQEMRLRFVVFGLPIPVSKENPPNGPQLGVATQGRNQAETG